MAAAAGVSQRRRAGSWWSQFSSSALRVKPAPVSFANDSLAKRLGGNAAPASSGLIRKLGLVDLILLGIGASIGAGIFVITGTVAHDAGPAVVFSFALAAAACVPNALSYAELSNRFPALVGGAYLYSYSTFNELTAFLVFCHLMIDYHIGAASISRSLASYLVTTLQVFPAGKALPEWFGPGGLELCDGMFSINVVAPLLLAGLTIILCQGVKESSVINDVMTVSKVVIVLMVIAVGSFEVDTSNWTPFAPNGLTTVITGATVVFFAYVGFDAVANSAEESKNPQRDLPIGILVSLFVCAGLYVAVCLVVTGMVPYVNLGGDAPLANAFTEKGLNVMSILISVGAICGLTTTVLVGLYVQSRLYLGLGRDGLLPAFFAKIHDKYRTPVAAQIWVGAVAACMAGLFNVSHLSHILSVGCLWSIGVILRRMCVRCYAATKHRRSMARSGESSSTEGSHSVARSPSMHIEYGFLGFLVGLCYRIDAPVAYAIALLAMMGLLTIPLLARQEYRRPSGFACPWVPLFPVLSIGFNMFLFAQLHWEAWVRFGVVTVIAILVYGFYGQYNAITDITSSEHSPLYYRAPVVDEEDTPFENSA